MAKKVLVVAPSLPMAIMAAEKVGLTPHEIVWIGEPKQLMGVDGGRYVEPVSDRPFAALDNPAKKQLYLDVLKEARARWAKVHGATWTQVYFL